MKKTTITCILLIVISLSNLTSCSVQSKEEGMFYVVHEKTIAQLIIDKNESDLVYTAAGLFIDDVSKVSRRKPGLNSKVNSNYEVKIGTLGVEPKFDKECIEIGINTEELGQKWESYVIKVFSSPPKKTLYVVGSNPRGTAFGLMELSKMIGVSPWYWWADVIPEQQEMISLPGDLLVEDGPKVKYRGIFLNDEDWGLQPWAAKTFEPETGDIGPKTYEKIFELLLRLKANSIWPAMHDCTRAFFTYPDNIKMADKYGIWVGSSHCEPMLRNNVDEWHRWEPSSGKRGAWNFDENPEQITEYWKQRVDTTANYDGIYTVGMRGIHDGSMPGGKDIDDKVRILGHVLDTQRKLLTDVTKKEITSIPQIFCPYKEVLKLYKSGASIPEDVTIMWADDNNGYIRQLSNEEERKRSGGAGVYYHISYWGRPHDFLWLESIPVSLIWEEMHKAYQTNAKNVWIVNVGDIKPNEIGMNFFLDMAWNPDQFSPENLDVYYTQFAASQFGKTHADEIGEILQKYFQLGFSRKPEHMGWNGVYPNTSIQDPELSLFNNGDEAQQRIDAYETLEKQVEELYTEMPDNLKDAFYELVGYKVIGASNMNKKILYAYKSRVYAKQGRMSSDLYSKKAEQAFEKIKKETVFYNDSLAGGKWKYMMSYNPRQLPVFDMPPVESYKPLHTSVGGVIPEGASIPTNENGASLPVFNALTDRSYFIDVFNSGIEPVSWKASVDQPWVKLSKEKGSTSDQDRIWVSVDWDQILAGDTTNSIIRFKLNDQSYPIRIMATNPNWAVANEKLFIEDNGVISMEAENYSRQYQTSLGNWSVIQSLGRTGDAIGTYPVAEPPLNSSDISKAPSLEYDFYSSSKGNAMLRFYCIPTLPINDDYQLRFAISIDGDSATIINAALKEEMDEDNPEWQRNVLRSFSIATSQISLPISGKHTLKVSMIDPGVVLDKIEVVLNNSASSYFGNPETINN